ncbi:MAG: coproporphyrinogen dehydrogenase HemZ, partial [Monoglobales bacterium]
TNEKTVIAESAENADVISIFDGENIITEAGGLRNENAVMPSKIRNEKQRIGDAAKLGYYQLAREIYGRDLPWGIITGIRPKKLVTEFARAGETEEFKKRFRVSDKKIALSMLTDKAQKNVMSEIDENSVCVYIGIPFCPTRCQYCSFVSLPMGKQQHLIRPYVDCLIKEMRATANLIKGSGKRVEALYIGGGTPTSLDDEMFRKVVMAAGDAFSFADLKEFTVEAGRADTITISKLRAAKDAGMTRICINPQTMNNDILKSIGRNHTAEEFERTYYMARELDISHINTDVIAGLPGETEKMFYKSIDKLLSMEPDGITVHTMCVKRAADLKRAEYITYDAEKMVDYAFDKLTVNGLNPYYLYRQKDTLGCLENTGFARQGKESVYNIFMMEDIGTVLGIGAGSVTKIKTDGVNKFKRVFNFKNPAEYISRFDGLLERKKDYGL